MVKFFDDVTDSPAYTEPKPHPKLATLMKNVQLLLE
jgi:hypothetical protein